MGVERSEIAVENSGRRTVCGAVTPSQQQRTRVCVRVCQVQRNVRVDVRGRGTVEPIAPGSWVHL